ncbi:centrosomal protein 15 [Pholidichthys leucotaenia]
MSAFFSEVDLIEEHENILGRRAELLEQMKRHREEMRTERRRQMKEREEAHSRNTALLQDLQKIEDHLKGRWLQLPNLLLLETKYWASVEESLPAWEHFMLGKGPHPTDGPAHPPRSAKQKVGTAKDQGLPPRPKRRTAR